MAVKHIDEVISPGATHFVGDGFKVHSYIPGKLSMQRMNPFIMMDYNSKFYFPPTDKPRGVGVHPHRGFETVTIAFKGKVAHHDSRGNSGVIGEGDVQWMTAGSGILHKEYHEEEFNRAGGDFQMLQLWVNLPAKDKMTEPKYQAILNAEFGRYEVPGGLGVVEVLAGEYEGVKGPATTFSPIQIYIGKVKRGARLDFSTPSNYNTALVNLEGSLSVDGTDIATDNFVLFANDGDSFTVEADGDTI